MKACSSRSTAVVALQLPLRRLQQQQQQQKRIVLFEGVTAALSNNIQGVVQRRQEGGIMISCTSSTTTSCTGNRFLSSSSGNNNNNNNTSNNNNNTSNNNNNNTSFRQEQHERGGSGQEQEQGGVTAGNDDFSSGFRFRRPGDMTTPSGSPPPPPPPGLFSKRLGAVGGDAGGYFRTPRGDSGDSGGIVGGAFGTPPPPSVLAERGRGPLLDSQRESGGRVSTRKNAPIPFPGDFDDNDDDDDDDYYDDDDDYYDDDDDDNNDNLNPILFAARNNRYDNNNDHDHERLYKDDDSHYAYDALIADYEASTYDVAEDDDENYRYGGALYRQRERIRQKKLRWIRNSTKPNYTSNIHNITGQSYGLGRRKTSTANVWIQAGYGEFIVNEKPMDEYFIRHALRDYILQPLIVTETCGLFDITIYVNGGGLSGQAGAIVHGLSRALQAYNPDQYRLPLKMLGYITRDSRRVERKKPGLVKARKAPQWVRR